MSMCHAHYLHGSIILSMSAIMLLHGSNGQQLLLHFSSPKITADIKTALSFQKQLTVLLIILKRSSPVAVLDSTFIELLHILQYHATTP